MMPGKNRSITKLSNLRVGWLYHMTGDDVDCTIEVVTEGVAPRCIVTGEFNDSGRSDDRNHPPTVIQLVGWSPFQYLGSDDDGEPRAAECFVMDEYPSNEAWLIGTWMPGVDDRRVECIACAPTIVRVKRLTTTTPKSKSKKKSGKSGATHDAALTTPWQRSDHNYDEPPF